MQHRIDYALLTRSLREAKQLTQEQFAHELGVTFGTVNGWEKGRHVPMPLLARRLVEMAAELDISTNMVSDGKGGT